MSGPVLPAGCERLLECGPLAEGEEVGESERRKQIMSCGPETLL